MTHQSDMVTASNTAS